MVGPGSERPFRATAIVSRGALDAAPGRAAAALASLRLLGWELTAIVAESRDQVVDLARRTVEERRDALIAIGGDGTFGAVAGPLRGADTVLVPLPAGTANGWAREMGVPLDPVHAAALVPTARLARVDVGGVRTRDTEHTFLATAGVGYDAVVVAETPRSLKRRLGIAAYVLTILKTWAAYRGGVVDLRAEGVHLHTRALLVSIGNTRAYGGILTVLPFADDADGLLDVCVFRGLSLRDKVVHVARVLLQRHARSPDVTYLRLARLEVDSAPPLPVQADGDYVGMTPVTVACYHLALRVLLPRAGSGQAG